jgi:chromosome segregation ATPase
MSENAVDIYCKIIPKDVENIEVIVWYNLGIIYLSSKEYSQGMAAAEGIMIEFSKLVYLNIFKEKLKEEEAILKKMNTELKNTQKQAQSFEDKMKDYESEISKIQKKISENKELLAANKEKQAKQKSEINTQEKTIDNTLKEIDAAKRKRK